MFSLKNTVRVGFAALLAAMIAATASAQPVPAAPVPVPAVPGPGPVVVNEVQIDRTKSFVDTTISAKWIYVTTVINYTTTGAGYVITNPVFDENTAAWSSGWLFGNVNATSFTTTGPGTGTVTFYYQIDATSAWGLDILANGGDQAWVTANMNSTIRLESTDSCWLKP